MYLKDELMLPFEKTSTYFKDKYNQKISPATILNIRREAFESLDKFENEIEECLVQSPVLHADETGLRVLGNRWWLHTIGDERLTLYAVHPNRGSKAVDDIGIIPKFKGIMVHDFWATYFRYNCKHSLCNAHIMRELEGIIDGYKQKWAGKMKNLFEDVYDCIFVQKIREQKKMIEFDSIYKSVLKEWFEENPPPVQTKGKKRGRIKRSKPLNLLMRLEEYREDILRFMYNSIVPFTNNLAERDVRMMKVQQKISGTFRSKE